MLVGVERMVGGLSRMICEVQDMSTSSADVKVVVESMMSACICEMNENNNSIGLSLEMM